jgi:hypothetical protein
MTRESGVDETRDMTVSCMPGGEGWHCWVSVGQDVGRTTHDVDVTEADLERLAPDATDPTTLVRESFEFLLEREPRESILRTFALPDIARYFPDYEAQIGRRMSSHSSG